MIDLLWTGIGGLAGGAAGVLAGWAANRWRGTRRWRRRVFGLLGGVVGAGLGAALMTPPALESQLDAAGPAITAIRTHYPGAYAAMRWAAPGVEAGDPVVLQDRLRPLVAEVIRRHRSEMDDASAQAMGQLMLDETEALRQAKPEACVAALAGRPLGVDLRGVEGPELRRRDAEVTAALIEQVATKPQPRPEKLSAEEAQRLTEHALAKLTSGERDVVLPLLQSPGRAPATTAEADAYCAFQRARLGAAIDAPAGTLRSFLAG